MCYRRWLQEKPFDHRAHQIALQEMIEAGVALGHADTSGNYMEVDTQEDFELARKHWLGKATEHVNPVLP